MGFDAYSLNDCRTTVNTYNNIVSIASTSHAVVSQLWIFNNSSSISHHVLTQVDLVPDEILRVDVPSNWKKRLGGKSNWTVYCENSKMQPELAPLCRQG